MNPNEATNMMRQESIDIINLANKLLQASPRDFSQEQLYRWMLAVMKQYTEFKWNMADFLDDLAQEHPFQLEHLDSQANFRLLKMNLDQPPFDQNFFENHRY